MPSYQGYPSGFVLESGNCYDDAKRTQRWTDIINIVLEKAGKTMLTNGGNL